MISDDYVTACGALPYRITPDGPEVLLVLPFESKGTWGLPKGRLENLETIEACVRREVREETGVSLETFEDLLPSSMFYGREGKPSKRVIAYLAKVKTEGAPPGPITVEEIMTAKFFSVYHMPPVHKYQRQTIESGVQLLKERHGRIS
jgi:ADP-ribose pyrophosphatase YjhB (NUDIX family)